VYVSFSVCWFCWCCIRCRCRWEVQGLGAFASALPFSLVAGVDDVLEADAAPGQAGGGVRRGPAGLASLAQALALLQVEAGRDAVAVAGVGRGAGALEALAVLLRRRRAGRLAAARGWMLATSTTVTLRQDPGDDGDDVR
jgi:hypothetical protein